MGKGVVARENIVLYTQIRNDSIKKTLFSCIEVSSLRLVETSHFVEIKCVRKLYERDIKVKSKNNKYVIF